MGSWTGLTVPLAAWLVGGLTLLRLLRDRAWRAPELPEDDWTWVGPRRWRWRLPQSHGHEHAHFPDIHPRHEH